MFYLYGNGIGDDGAEALSLSTLVNLSSLEHNNIGGVGTKAITSSSTLTQLTVSNLSGNNIGADGARAIAESSTLTNLLALPMTLMNLVFSVETIVPSFPFSASTSLRLSSHLLSIRFQTLIPDCFQFVHFPR